MYKIQPNTLFIGKKIIYLPSCQSTNDEATEMLRKQPVYEGTVVITDYQTAGRGQRGNIWLAQAGENLTLSIILRPHFLTIAEQFRLNVAISLGVYDFLYPYIGNSLKIKWPNDIYVNNQKLGGILIENSIQGKFIEHAIVGIGLNINQYEFQNSLATSLKLITKREFDLPTLFSELLQQIEKNYLLLRNNKYLSLKESYLSCLFRYQELHLFKKDNTEFWGIIVGINEIGKLAIQVENTLQFFDLKEVSYVI